MKNIKPSLAVCLYAHLYIHLSNHPSIQQPNIQPAVHQNIHLSIYPPIHSTTHHFFKLCIFPSIQTFTQPSTYAIMYSSNCQPFNH